MNWTEMRQEQFSRDGLSRKQRAVVETAADSLFPDMMPEASRKPADPACDPMGTEPMFGPEDL